MAHRFHKLVIVGGGTAGWLSAAYLAARRPELDITLVEAPDIPTIGVGEGTWPTMRETLAVIGIPEEEFLRECEASFKQGSRFDGWKTGAPDDSYLHPFMPPPGEISEMIAAWSGDDGASFSELVTAQAAICAKDLAPRQRNMPPYSGALNYGYHLDAGKFAGLLARHATERLGVTHVSARVGEVLRDDAGLIEAVQLREGRRVDGDFFIDCTGMAALLIGDHYGTGWVDRSDVSFNDRALAAQVPTLPGSAIASQTVGTAHAAGWLWDIALPTRRGIGCVYSSRFTTDEEAEATLRAYVSANVPGANIEDISPRKLAFKTGHRDRFWVKNCVAIGLSAGFIEPLEASAIVLIELSLRALADNWPASDPALPVHADRFNTLFRYRWDRVVDFLKLHYVLSERPEPYWLAQRSPDTLPATLEEQLAVWRDQPPSAWDFPQLDEIFSAASQQYVLYGMGFPAPAAGGETPSEATCRRIREVNDQTRKLAAALPTNRVYFDALEKHHAVTPQKGEIS